MAGFSRRRRVVSGGTLRRSLTGSQGDAQAIYQSRQLRFILLGFIIFWVGSWIVAGAPLSIQTVPILLAILAILFCVLLLLEVLVRRRYLEFVGDGTIRIRHGDFVKTAALEDVVFLLPGRSRWNYLIYREVYAVIDGKAVGCPYAHAGPLGWSRGMKRFIKALGENGIEYEFY
jgi:hypothetical protein